MATAWVAGGSGLVGGFLLRELLAEGRYERVVSVGRREIPVAGAATLVQHTVPSFIRPLALGDAPAPEVAFCALGTTIKKAGSQAAFRSVDHDAVLAFAEVALARGARTFLHVTALGADPASRVFYNRVKGETERDVARLGFGAVYALRPSILDGPRAESRPGERAGLAVARALAPLIGKYRPTRAEDVARAMVALAGAPRPGGHVVSAEEIPKLAR